MEVPYNLSESAEQRHNRLLSVRIIKAKIINDRVIQFVDDINKSTIFKDSEKNKILSELKFIKP